MHEKIQDVYISILSMFYNPSSITRSRLHLIDPNNNSHHLPVNQIYLGATLHGLFNKVEYQRGNMINDVKERCRRFAIVMCEEIRSRFDVNNSLWRSAVSLQPRAVLDRSLRREVPSLSEMAREAPLINIVDKKALDDEWRSIPCHPFKENIKDILHDAEKFFTYIIQITDETEAPKFACLGRFALQMLSLPTCNADVEHIFSKLSLIKRKERNCLKLETVRSLMRISECYDGDFKAFEPSKEMLKVFKNQTEMYIQCSKTYSIGTILVSITEL